VVDTDTIIIDYRMTFVYLGRMENSCLRTVHECHPKGRRYLWRWL